MDDLISRETAIELIENRQRKLCPVGMFSRNAVYGSDREKFDCWQEIIDEIERLPAVNAVPVVRCKDCVYYESVLSDDVNTCSRGFGWTAPDDYCSKGERRNDA